MTDITFLAIQNMLERVPAEIFSVVAASRILFNMNKLIENHQQCKVKLWHLESFSIRSLICSTFPARTIQQ